jgi:anti-sigma regulatory factor (Ser/Thr protein kinase)
MSQSRTFPPDLHSVGAARHFVADSLRSTPTDHFAAALLVSELAANAVTHAETPFAVNVERRTGVVRIEVSNDAPELLATMTQPSEEGGFGLHLVDQLSQHWGTESAVDKKVVWFELASH